MLIEETWINATENYQLGSSGLYEPYTDKVGKLFLLLQREYGKCISKVYIDSATGQPKAIGWVFQKLARYTDTNEPYLQETWVTLHDDNPKVTTKYNYHYLN